MTLSCLAHMSEYDPCGAETTETLIWEGFANEAGVTLEELKEAYIRVKYDGYDGPISDEDWEEQHGTPMPLKKAIAILHTALEYEPAIKYTHPDCGYSVKAKDLDEDFVVKHCEEQDIDPASINGDDHLWVEEEITIDPEEIKKCCFPAIWEIYGHSL